MNIFTKIDKFFRPSKYKEDTITKPLALMKKNDYIFVLVLKENPFEFDMEKIKRLTENSYGLYFTPHELGAATLIKAQLMKKEVLLTNEYWELWSEELFTYGGGIWDRHQLEISFENKTQTIISSHKMIKQDGLYVFISTDKEYIAKVLRQTEKNIVLFTKYLNTWKETNYWYNTIINFKRQLSSLRFKLMRI